MSAKSTHHQFTIWVVHTVRHRIMSLKSAFFHTQQVPPEHMNVAYSRPPHNPYSQRTTPVGEITQISLRPRIILPGQTFPIIFTIPILNQVSPVKLYLPPPKVHQWKRNSVNCRRNGSFYEVPIHFHAKSGTNTEQPFTGHIEIRNADEPIS